MRNIKTHKVEQLVMAAVAFFWCFLLWFASAAFVPTIASQFDLGIKGVALLASSAIWTAPLARPAPDGARGAQAPGARGDRRIKRRHAMAETRKVIVTCAVTGAIHTPTMSPHLPITPQEIAEQSIAAAEAGGERAAGAAAAQCDDVLNALLALGYSEKEASWAAKQVPADAGVSDGIRQALLAQGIVLKDTAAGATWEAGA